MDKRQIVEEKQGFEALLHDGAGLQYLLDTVICGILTLDRQGRVVYSNNSARHLLGISREQLIGYPLDTSRWLPFDKEAGILPGWEPPFARVLGRGETLRGEIYAVERGESSDERLYISVNAVPLRDPQGEISGAAADFVDITERIRMRREFDRLLTAVKESEALYRTLAESAPVGVFESDAEGCWSYVNPRWSAISGRSPCESLGMGWTEAIHPDDREEILAAWKRSAAEEGTWRREFRLLLPAGRDVWVRTLKSPVASERESGRRFVGTVEDVTAAKEAEFALHRAKEGAAEASLSKSRFLSTIGHEVRTPMTVFMGMVELTLKGAIPCEQRRYLEMAYDAAESLLLLLEDILAYADLETGRMPFARESFDLPASMEAWIGPFAAEARSKGIKLDLQFAPALPRRWSGDPKRLRQVLHNVVGNAVKFTITGEVTVKVDCEKACAEFDPLVFSVRDTGIGIPPEKLSTLFHPFSQVDPSDTRKFGGTGLGLAISRALIERMGGEIRVESIPGHGSIFTFTVPSL